MFVLRIYSCCIYPGARPLILLCKERACRRYPWMSTTWVSLDELCGRELAMATMSMAWLLVRAGLVPLSGSRLCKMHGYSSR